MKHEKNISKTKSAFIKLRIPIVCCALALGIFSGASNIKANCYDFTNFAILAEDFLKTGPGFWGDLNIDEKVDYNDLKIFTDCWPRVVYLLEPYVMAFDENTEKIRVKTNVSTTAEVKYGTSPTYGYSVIDGNNSQVHEFTISELAPGTLYYYNIETNDGYETSSYKSSFITSDNSKKCYRFGYFGDSRGDASICGDVGYGEAGKRAYRSMLQQMIEKGAEFVIFSGDGMQAYNCVKEPEIYDAAWENFHKYSSPLRGNLSIPYLSALGNHELGAHYYQVGKDAFARYWMHPMNGAGKANNWEETIFSWRYGNTNFIFLNSEEDGNEAKMTDEQRAWFATALQKTGFDNKFVISHRALVGSIRSDPTGAPALQGIDPSLSACMDNLMYENNVTAGLYAHEHYYNYNTTHNGNMIHIISGGAGTELRPCSYVPPIAPFGTGCTSSIYSTYCEPWKWHYIIIDVNNSSMTGTVYDSNGVQFDSFSK